MLLETGLLLKMQSDCLPVGGALRVVTSGFPSNGCNLITVRSHRRRRERQSGRKLFIFNESRRQAPARAARRVLDGESVEES